jgi:Fe-S-cluster-containing dehydrogenase component
VVSLGAALVTSEERDGPLASGRPLDELQNTGSPSSPVSVQEKPAPRSSRPPLSPAVKVRRRAFAAWVNGEARSAAADVVPDSTALPAPSVVPAGVVAAAIAFLSTATSADAQAAPAGQVNAGSTAGGGEQSAVMRMHADLKRALDKPVDQRRWVMVIDQQKCIGCSACTIACIAENKLPPGVVYRPVMEEEVGTYPNVSRRFIARPCMQCDSPPCVDVCPVSATYKRPDGIVAINYDQCIGCRYCIAACPYNARVFDSGDYWTAKTPQPVQAYEQLPAYEYGQKRVRKAGSDASPIGNARKCQFCVHRLDAGMLPACVTTCIGNATYFGDASDPDSLVSELTGSSRVMRLKEELGTKPRVYYLI